MNIINIIEKKKNDIELSEEEIKFFIDGLQDGSIKDYQSSALLMAICFNELNSQETQYLTNAMLNSGEVLDLSKTNQVIVDKHSTGGIGDKTTLVVAPLLACFGLSVAKMSGRGLGYTGGTLDKLESIDGFNINLSEEEFISQVKDINISVIGQTKELVPADKKLYALRDVTATIDSISLIASSIMSKKLASGAQYILLDVKYGSGAFMKDKTSAVKLANKLVEIGKNANRVTFACISSMEQPLGKEVGNSNEVLEAIKTLQGRGPDDLTYLCKSLVSNYLLITKKFKDENTAIKAIDAKINSGEAYKKFEDFVYAQGAKRDSLDKLKVASNILEIKSTNSGYIKQMDAVLIGTAAMHLGAGRVNKEDSIDHEVGITLNYKVGDVVSENDTLFTIHYNDSKNLKNAQELLEQAVSYSYEKVDKISVIDEYIY